MRSLVVLCLLCGPALADPIVEKSRVEVAPAGHAFKKLAIENPLGDVRIEGYDGTAIQIQTEKHAPDEETLDRLRVSLVPDPDGTVRIATTVDKHRESRAVSKSQIRIDLVIRAPRDARVEATLQGGRLELKNMDAGGDLDTSSGAISVKNVSGELWTHSVSGPMSIAEAFGSVDAATVSSDVDLDSINGDKLVASAHRGRIAGRRVRSREVELTTTEGKIQLEAEAALRGHLVVSSLRGDVDVKLHRHGAVVIRARGTKVDLGAQARNEPDGWTQAQLGDGSATALVELQSRYGIVQFAIVE